MKVCEQKFRIQWTLETFDVSPFLLSIIHQRR